MLHLRALQYYDKDGKELPGKKGIALSIEQWEKLVEHVDAVTEEVHKRGGKHA